MALFTYKKILYENLPEVIQKSIVEFTKDSIVIDDTNLSAAQKTRINEFLTQNGYKLQ